jgi:hypothetical protein
MQELIEKALQVHFDYVELGGRDRHIHWQVIDYSLINVSLRSKLLQTRRAFISQRFNVVRIDHLAIRVWRRADLFLPSVCPVVRACQASIS